MKVSRWTKCKESHSLVLTVHKWKNSVYGSKLRLQSILRLCCDPWQTIMLRPWSQWGCSRLKSFYVVTVIAVKDCNLEPSVCADNCDSVHHCKPGKQHLKPKQFWMQKWNLKMQGEFIFLTIQILKQVISKLHILTLPVILICKANVQN